VCNLPSPLFLLYKLISISSKQCQLNYSIKLKSPEINQAFAIIRIKVSQARKTMDRPSNFRKSRQESIMWRETEQYFHNPIGIRQSTFRLAHRPYIPCRWSRTIYIHIHDFPWGKNHRSWRNLRAHYSWFTRLSASDTTRYRANHQYNREKDHFPISRVYIEASNVVISLLLSELSRPRSRIAFPFAEPFLTMVLTTVHRFSLAFPRRTFCPARFQRSREFRRRNNSLVEKSTGSPDYACSSFQLVFKSSLRSRLPIVYETTN